MLLKSAIRSGVFLAFAIIWGAYGQSVKKPVRIINTRDGLPQSFVSGLAQDANGFVWIGTLNGVARYDGIHFKVFRSILGDSSTISSNVVLSMAPGKDKSVWIGYGSRQIDLLDPMTEKVTRVTSRPLFKSNPIPVIRRGWLGDQQKNLWVFKRAGGVHRFDFKHNKITHFSRMHNDFSNDTIRGILEDSRSRIWILDQGAIGYLDDTKQRFRFIKIPFPLDFNNQVDSDLEVVGLRERANGEIMFSDRGRLIFFQPKTGSFRYKALLTTPRTGIRSIQAGPDGNEYFETDGTVYRYNDQSGIVKIGEIENPARWETPAFLVDYSGLIWLGTNAAGIHQIDLAMPLFESKPILHSFHEDLIQEELKISLSNIAGWPFDKQNFAGSSYLVRSRYDAKGRLWLALRNKVGYYDTTSKRLVLLPDVPGVSIPGDLALGIRGLSFAPDSTLWIVSDSGKVLYFDGSEKKWVSFIETSNLRKKAGAPVVIVDCYVDQNRLFLTTAYGRGLLIVDIDTKKVHGIPTKIDTDMLLQDLLLGIVPDPTRPELLWIGSYNGLILLDKKTLKSQVFSMQDGLPDNTIYAILTDESGHLWLSTNKGICRFHPVTHKIQTFLSDDGLPGDEFNRFQGLKLPDGRLAFGGTEGWTLFDPDAMKPDTYRPQVAFTNLKINNINASAYKDPLILPGMLNSGGALSLPYDLNSLTFEFAGLEFNRPKRLKYRYQLVGYDNDWMFADNSPVASYTKLPAGKYQLMINSSNSTGQWSPNIRVLELRIKPPFWLTWWAHCIYALVVAGLIWAYARYLANRERLRHEILVKNREAEQFKILDSLKTRFFSNITHEFRTPLTLILTPAQRLKPTLKDADQQRWLSAIERNANQLLRLINQLLDLSKLESGNLKVNEALGNPGKFLEAILSSFVYEAEAKGIILTFKQETESGNYWFDPDKLEQIVSNLIANAIKFTPNGGEVEVTLGVNGNAVYISVCDSGIGISPEKLQHVFDRYYQAGDPVHARQFAVGSGIGLSIVKEMVELQKGAISVESPVTDSRWSTRFSVRLPYRMSDETGAADISPKYFTNTEIAITSQVEPLERETRFESDGEISTILLVEDNVELAEFIVDSLASNYRVIQAYNGAEGLEQAIETAPDLVLSDVLMPVMDGLEFCKNLKTDERTNHIPVIMLTARSSFDDKIEGLTTGADDYLTKPFHIQELQLRIGNLLERQRQFRNKLRAEINTPGSPAVPEEEQQTITLQDIFIRKLYKVIEERLEDSAFGVEQLAAEAGMSRASLHRKLKSLTGTAPGDLIRNYRLKRAAEFLKAGYNSSETAFKTGFDSASYFSKCFRDFYHISPNEFV